MRVKLEIAAILLGLLGAGIDLIVILAWYDLPTELREPFRGGSIGAQFVGFLMLFGIVGIALFVINMLTAQYKYLMFRGICLVCFLSLIVIIGILL